MVILSLELEGAEEEVEVVVEVVVVVVVGLKGLGFAAGANGFCVDMEGSCEVGVDAQGEEVVGAPVLNGLDEGTLVVVELKGLLGVELFVTVGVFWGTCVDGTGVVVDWNGFLEEVVVVVGVVVVVVVVVVVDGAAVVPPLSPSSSFISSFGSSTVPSASSSSPFG